MKTVVSSASGVSVTAPSATVSIVPKVEPSIATTDVSLQFQTPNSATNSNKRPVSLDLNKGIPTKKQRVVGPSPLMVDSADLQNMKPINTPDLEKFLLSNNLIQTPQPGVVFPSKGPITSEQEAFGKGFEDALHNLHNSKNTQAQLNNNSTNSITAVTATAATTAAAGTGMSGGSFTYTNLESSFPVVIKDEPQNPPSSPPVSPIDMETQEKIKLERKRQRNRVAASKCRKRKLERISKLEEKVKVLKGENTDLGLVVKNLKDHVAQLKQQVIEHIESGCRIQTFGNGSALLQSK